MESNIVISWHNNKFRWIVFFYLGGVIIGLVTLGLYEIILDDEGLSYRMIKVIYGLGLCPILMILASIKYIRIIPLRRAHGE